MIPRAFARLSPLLRSRRLSFTLTLLVAAAWVPAPARCQIVVPDGFSDQLLIGGLDAPVGMAWLPDGRLLFIEQNSRRIRLLVNGALASTDPVVTVDDVRTSGGEQGLLGIAVDPGWPARPYVYVHCDNQSAQTIRVSRYTVTGDLGFTGNGALAIGTSSRYDLINDVPDVASNHNGGTLRFGTDGMLYASFGEDADKCAAQDKSLHGVILRLDVSRLPAGSGGPPPRALIVPPGNPFPAMPDSNALLIWAYGLRNPFRFQIDPMDNALWIGDVGEDKREEIDRAAMGGINFGWPRWEGTLSNTPTCPAPGAVDPIYDYDRSGGTAAVICGGAYRRPSGSATGFPANYEGDVFFNDYYFGFLRRLTPDGSGGWRIADPVPGQASSINWGSGFQAVSDWSVGPAGSLWYVRQSLNFQGTSGQIRKIVAMSGPDTLPVDTLPRSGIEFARPFPIPARGAVNLSYTLSEPVRLSLKIYDSRGALVRTLVPDGVQSATRHDVLWLGIDDAGEDVPAGIYYARYVAAGRDRSFMIPLIR